MLHLKDDMDVSSLTFLGTIAHILGPIYLVWERDLVYGDRKGEFHVTGRLKKYSLSNNLSSCVCHKRRKQNAKASRDMI